MSDIVIKGISKAFGTNCVLKDFSAFIPEGARVCIMGASGSGKTTLMNIMLGLIKPDSGILEGFDVKQSAVFQEDRLCEEISTVKNAELAAGKGILRSDTLACLNELGLGGYENEKAANLSGGMKRRAAIARALLCDYHRLYLDEPFKGLDEELKKQTAEYIMRSAGGRTLVVITHDISDVEAFKAELIKMP